MVACGPCLQTWGSRRPLAPHSQDRNAGCWCSALELLTLLFPSRDRKGAVFPGSAPLRSQLRWTFIQAVTLKTTNAGDLKGADHKKIAECHWQLVRNYRHKHTGMAAWRHGDMWPMSSDMGNPKIPHTAESRSPNHVVTPPTIS